MSLPRLSPRSVNRALLARQGLLERSDRPPLEAVGHLLALQAQDARPPFLALWARLRDFRREDLARLIAGHSVVRASLMRGTLHLVLADDYGWLRATLAASLEQISLGLMRARKASFDPEPIRAFAEALFARGPLTFAAVRAALAERFAGLPPDAMSYVPRLRLPLALQPDASAWAYPKESAFLPAASLGVETGGEPDLPRLIRRFLAAHGPAGAPQAQAFTGLTRLAPVLAGMTDLAMFEDEAGRVLYDLEEAPRPDAQTEAPVRLVPEFDPIVLGHVEPAILPAGHAKRYASPNGRIPSRILVDGFAAGTWTSGRRGAEATLTLQLHAKISRKDRRALEDEAMRLIAFIEPDASQHALRVHSA